MTQPIVESILDKSYNVKLHFSADGTITIGCVMGFFDVDDNIYDILPVSDDVVRGIARALGVVNSSRTELSPKRKKENHHEKQGFEYKSD